MVAFLSSDCGPCRTLSDELVTLATTSPEIARRVLPVVMAANESPTPAIATTLNFANYETLMVDGSLSDETGVRGTPMLLSWDAASLKVIEEPLWRRFALDHGSSLSQWSERWRDKLMAVSGRNFLDLRQRHEVGCATASGRALPRRPVLKAILTASAAVSSSFGGLVAFAPSAAAAVRCDATSPVFTGCGVGYRPCIGPCTTGSPSCCRHGDGANDRKCCASFSSNRSARIVVYSSGKSCYYCCQYC